jgi:hypothetical protein
MSSALDINLYESGSGGDITISNADILLGAQLFMQPFLALFGGNTEASTRGDEVAGQIRYDWWGNALLLADNAARQFNSNTERALLNNALTSTGRTNIINAVKSDLKYLADTAGVTVDAAILSVNKLQIIITLTDTVTGQTTAQQMTWDAAKQELVIEQVI